MATIMVRLKRSSQKKAKGLENFASRSVTLFLSICCPSTVKYTSLIGQYEHACCAGVVLAFETMELHRMPSRAIEAA
jgi:hypothetical protein